MSDVRKDGRVRYSRNPSCHRNNKWTGRNCLKLLFWTSESIITLARSREELDEEDDKFQAILAFTGTSYNPPSNPLPTPLQAAVQLQPMFLIQPARIRMGNENIAHQRYEFCYLIADCCFNHGGSGIEVNDYFNTKGVMHFPATKEFKDTEPFFNPIGSQTFEETFVRSLQRQWKRNFSDHRQQR